MPVERGQTCGAEAQLAALRSGRPRWDRPAGAVEGDLVAAVHGAPRFLGLVGPKEGHLCATDRARIRRAAIVRGPTRADPLYANGSAGHLISAGADVITVRRAPNVVLHRGHASLADLLAPEPHQRKIADHSAPEYAESY
jgi:hypothetical protein